MTLERQVRYNIGLFGPQHDSEEDYNNYIDKTIQNMTNLDMLYHISLALEDIKSYGEYQFS